MSKPNTSHWTVKKYTDDIFIPDKQLKLNINDRTAYHYRNAASLICKAMGRDVKLREVNDRMLHQFVEWSVKQRDCVKRTARDRAETVRRIIRHWRPDAFPVENCRGATALPHWQDADCTESLEHLFQERYLPENPKITSVRTIGHYGRAFKLFGQCLGKIPRLDDLTDHNLGVFLRWLVTEHSLKQVSANGYAKQIKALWNWASKKRLVEHYPTIANLPTPEVIPQAWSRDQLSDLMESCRRASGLICGIKASDWWLAFHYLLWDCGERTGAVLSLRWDMLNEESGHLKVPASVRKGRSKAMVYQLKQTTLAKLEDIRSPERELIFPVEAVTAVSDWFYRRYRLLLESAGLPYERYKCGPQKMRRTFASHIKAAGGDATRALRHSTTRVTDDSYLDPSIADPISPNELLFDLAGKGGAV